MPTLGGKRDSFHSSHLPKDKGEELAVRRASTVGIEKHYMATIPGSLDVNLAAQKPTLSGEWDKSFYFAIARPCLSN
jgi:hypothetical protein